MSINDSGGLVVWGSVIFIVSELRKASLLHLWTKSSYSSKLGGCSGLSYKLEFDSTIKEGDQVFEDKGIKIAVDKKSFLYLIGTELDYTGGLNGKGFVFINPNASRTCGCGESFSV